MNLNTDISPIADIPVIGICLDPPHLADNTADAERLARALAKRLGAAVDVDYPLVKELPGLLRRHGWRLDCVVCPDKGRWTLIAALGPGAQKLAGLAVDLGTTRIALRLIDLADGRTLAEDGFDNPQIAIGPDVLTRIHHADQPEGRQTLQRLVVDGLNDGLRRLCHGAGLTADRICLAALAGNTAMTHLFLGADPTG